MLTSLSRMGWHALTQNRRFLRREQRRLLDQLGDSARVLEVGSGQSRGGRFFQSAVEVAPPTVSIVMTDLDSSLGHLKLDITVPDTSLGRFDLVLCCNVLEHVADLSAAVAGLATLTSQQGKVFASTPFVYPYHDEPADFWRPTIHGLRYVFLQHFEQVEVGWVGLRRFPFQVFIHAMQPRR